MKTPILLITNDRWSREPYVVFDGEEILGNYIPDEWVDEAYEEAIREYNDYHDEDENEPTYPQVEEQMEKDFLNENTSVNEFWAEHHILRCGDNYYKYDDDGCVKSIDEDTALELMPTVREEKIQIWRDEQKEIESAEVTTPRQAGVINRFGIDEDERNEMADNTTLLRKYRNKLYVYECQLGEPAQWRLLQLQPHMPTGTLRRPKGV